MVGLEGALVDNTTMRVASLDVGDARGFEVRVAGEAALVVAKCHKVGERLDVHRGVEAKDAFDIFRIVQHASTEGLARDVAMLLQSDIAADVTAGAIEYLRAHFSAEDQEGCRLAQEAVGILDPDGTVGPSLAALVQDLLGAVAT